MKITQVETLCLSRTHESDRQWFTGRSLTVKADCAIVRIHTDEEAVGIGEACAYGGPARIREWVSWLSTDLIGRDPRNLDTVPHPNGRSVSYDCAVGGIDSALWDLKGKLAGVRVSELMAENPPPRVRLYASSGCRYDWRDRPESLIDETLGHLDEGYTACKIRIGTEWSWDNVTVDRFLGLMRELTQAVDGRLDLMLDGNQRLDEDSSLTIAKELDRLNFAWFEEPIPKIDLDGYVRLNASVKMPITGGEQWTTLEQFRPYLERDAYAIVQPDAGWCGITEAKRIGEMAHRYGIHLCPHSWHNGLMAMANGHLVASLPVPRVLELCMIQGPLQWEILAEKPKIQDGWLELPDQPGLGVALAEGLEERFPYIEGHYAIEVER